ncbi:hypothetical protein OG589_04425 [Sphaerisporangium sp. NBC_01403]
MPVVLPAAEAMAIGLTHAVLGPGEPLRESVHDSPRDGPRAGEVSRRPTR